jgi:hypothetical protein
MYDTTEVPCERVFVSRPKKAQLPNLFKNDDKEFSGEGESWDVFQEREAGSYFANDADGLGPHISVIGFSGPPAGETERLARKASGNDINPASPWPSIKTFDVVPDGEQGKQTVPLAPQECLAGVLFDFDGRHGSPPQEVRSEDSPASSGKKCQLTHEPSPSAPG